MLQFGKLVRFLGMVLFGIVITLATSFAKAQAYDSSAFKQELQNCYTSVSQYPNHDDLDKYTESELYCLFMVELVDGGIAVDQEYDTERLDDAILTALLDEGDQRDGNTADDDLLYEEIQAEFSDDELNQLIQQAIAAADQQTAVPGLPQIQGLKVIAPKQQKTSNGMAPAIAQSSNGRARGGSAAAAFASGASQQARRD